MNTDKTKNTKDYKTPVGPAGSEEGKTQVSAVVSDTRLRPKGFRDTVQVTMLPDELAGPVMERAQAIFDKANKTQWLPWRHQDSGISFVKESGEPLSPTEIMPTDQSNETILLKGNKYGQRKAAELRGQKEGPRADKAKGRKSQGNPRKFKGNLKDGEEIPGGGHPMGRKSHGGEIN